MKIAHISDTHGHLTPIPDDVDIIVHSGDLLPNRSFGLGDLERAYQPQWIEDNQARLRAWIKDRPFLITHGNHDYILSQKFLRDVGIDAHSLDDRRHEQDGVVFYGFPHVPAFGPFDNYQCSNRELTLRLEAVNLEGVNVLVAHSPIYGVLDANGWGNYCGSKPMRKFLQDSPHVPEYYLCGHIHESQGYQAWSRGIRVYNSATTCQVIEI